MIIPHDQLSPAALRGVIEEYVTRDGTELTDAEDKVAQVKRRLDAGKAQIVYDEQTKTCSIVRTE